MSEHAHSHDHGDDHGGHHAVPDSHYIKIWAILCVLLVISVLGPEIGIPLLTLITAFGIAFIKAYMVMKNFMHLNVEKPIIHYVIATCLVFMVLFFSGTAPAVMKHEGLNWENVTSKEVVRVGLEKMAAEGDGHGGGDDH